MRASPVLIQLFKRDFLSLRRLFPSKFFDTFIFFLTNALVWGYITPQQATSNTYGTFLIVGSIGIFGLIEVVAQVSLFISDLEGKKTISSLLILPIQANTLLAYRAFFWAITSGMLSFLLFPIGKLLLFSQFNLENISYFKTLLIFITANLFYGFFALWVASLVKKLHSIEWLWARIIGPMWMFGAFYYSWNALAKLSYPLALFNLLNPLVFIMEALRSAVLGPSGYLPFWPSLGIVWVWIIGCGWQGIRSLKKRLDTV